MIHPQTTRTALRLLDRDLFNRILGPAPLHPDFVSVWAVQLITRHSNRRLRQPNSLDELRASDPSQWTMSVPLVRDGSAVIQPRHTWDPRVTPLAEWRRRAFVVLRGTIEMTMVNYRSMKAQAWVTYGELLRTLYLAARELARLGFLGDLVLSSERKELRDAVTLASGAAPADQDRKGLTDAEYIDKRTEIFALNADKVRTWDGYLQLWFDAFGRFLG